jgi:CubicO group peptidase (beta-lactamase class C family)
MRLKDGLTLMDIAGYCDPKFQAVADAFTRCFTEHGDVGASVAVTVEGEMVVDLWGGFMDEEATKPWEEQTLGIVFSATKGIVTTAVHMLVEQGQIDPDSPIARYWPEYAQNGKQNVTLRQVMSHTAGLPFIDAELYMGAPYDWQTMIEACAAQKPEWEPGSTHAYHSATFGWIVGEVIHRVSGQMPGEFIASEIAEPLGAEFYLGLPESQDSNVSDWIHSQPEASSEPPPEPPTETPSYGQRLGFVRANLPPNPLSSRAWRAAQMPASNGHSNGRGFAKIYQPLALDGAHNGVRIMERSTIEAAIVQQVDSYDTLLKADAKRAVGYKLIWPDLGEKLGERTFGHPGLGGSLGCADPDKRMSLGYVMNKPWSGPRGSDPRSTSILEAVYECID